MRRYAGQRPLYEAWSRSRGKPKRPSLLERLRPPLAKLRQVAAERAVRRPTPPEPAAEKPAPATLKPPKPAAEPEPAQPTAGQPWLKSKAVQFNAGRIEISLPYQIAIGVGLLLILILLVAFRLGQIDQKARYPTTRSTPAEAGERASSSVAPPDNSGSSAAAPTVPAGDNVIVIARSQNKADLAPVAAHFAEHGIKTGYIPYERLRQYYAEHGLNAEAVPQGNGFLLTTMEMFDNPDREGTDGYAMKEKIKEVGALYKGKAPSGLESFAPNYFSDAYGLKVK